MAEKNFKTIYRLQVGGSPLCVQYKKITLKNEDEFENLVKNWCRRSTTIFDTYVLDKKHNRKHPVNSKKLVEDVQKHIFWLHHLE